jgi:hypothetical protein
MYPHRAAVAAAVHAALTASHTVADHLVQTDAQAVAKGRPGAEGRAACAAHVATYTATQAAAVYAAHRVLHLQLRPAAVTAALALSALTHYAIDRSAGHWSEQQPSTRLVRLLHRTGKGGWLTRDPQAPYRCDQALHQGVLAICAAIAAY